MTGKSSDMQSFLEYSTYSMQNGPALIAFELYMLYKVYHTLPHCSPFLVRHGCPVSIRQNASAHCVAWSPCLSPPYSRLWWAYQTLMEAMWSSRSNCCYTGVHINNYDTNIAWLRKSPYPNVELIVPRSGWWIFLCFLFGRIHLSSSFLLDS